MITPIFHPVAGVRRGPAASARFTAMGGRTEAPCRADRVGSLLRPPEVLAARERFAAGELDADGLREIEDAAISEAVARQEEVGLQAATDGEFRRTSWHMD